MNDEECKPTCSFRENKEGRDEESGGEDNDNKLDEEITEEQWEETSVSKRLRKKLYNSLPDWEHMKSANAGEKLKQKMNSAWNNVKYNSLWMNDRSSDYKEGATVVILSRIYSLSGSRLNVEETYRSMCSDYHSRVWLTYRTSFPPLPSSSLTTDCGWGCTLRSAQMTLAHALSLIHLSRDWRYVEPTDGSELEENSPDRRIVKLFNDNPASPLSLHSMFELDGSGMGTWFAPSEAFRLLRLAVNRSNSPLTTGLEVVIRVDGRVNLDELEEKSANWTRKVLLVVALRLGLSHINKQYYASIKTVLHEKSCLGLVGGKKHKSIYTIGYSDNDLIYLDPHVAQPYVDSVEDVSSFHCKLLSRCPLSSIDPSFAISFLLTSHQQTINVFNILGQNGIVDREYGGDLRRNEFPLFTVSDEPIPLVEDRIDSEEDHKVAESHGFNLL